MSIPRSVLWYPSFITSSQKKDNPPAKPQDDLSSSEPDEEGSKSRNKNAGSGGEASDHPSRKPHYPPAESNLGPIITLVTSNFNHLHAVMKAEMNQQRNYIQAMSERLMERQANFSSQGDPSAAQPPQASGSGSRLSLTPPPRTPRKSPRKKKADETPYKDDPRKSMFLVRLVRVMLRI